MSTTVQGVDARAYLVGWLSAVTSMTVADIKAIPDDKWTDTYGGCSRPANALIGDTITNLMWTTGAVSGENLSVYNDMPALIEKCVDKDFAIRAFEEASAAFGAAVSAASDEALNATVMAPWQMQTPVMILAHIAVAHIWYHDGQFNYIQCMLGDGDVHWKLG